MDYRASPSRFNDVKFFISIVGQYINEIKDTIHSIKYGLKELSRKYNVKNDNITSLVSSIDTVIHKSKFGKTDVHLLFPYINNIKKIREDLLHFNIEYSRQYSRKDNESDISTIYNYIMLKLGYLESALSSIKMTYKYIGRYNSSSKSLSN